MPINRSREELPWLYYPRSNSVRVINSHLGGGGESLSVRDSSIDTSGGTNWTVNLPSEISSGDYLILAVVNDTSAVSLTTPSGWTLLATIENVERLTVFSKVADGSETTVSLTLSWGEDGHYIAISVAGAASIENQSNSTNNPPSISPTWGSGGLALAIAAARANSGSGFTTFPSGYTSLGTSLSETLGRPDIAAAWKSFTGSSEDPGAFVGGAQVGSVTIALQAE
jgi:hypothetical protein